MDVFVVFAFFVAMLLANSDGVDIVLFTCSFSPLSGSEPVLCWMVDGLESPFICNDNDDDKRVDFVEESFICVVDDPFMDGMVCSCFNANILLVSVLVLSISWVPFNFVSDLATSSFTSNLELERAGDL